MVSTRSRTREQQVQPATPAVEEPAQQPTQPKNNAAATKPAAKRRRVQPPSAKKANARVKPEPKPTKGKKSKAQDPISDGQNRLQSLPPEILCMVLDNVKDVPSISALSRTCKDFHGRMVPRLYRRIVTAAGCHPHIAKFIRTIEPFLTIAQKKQLKKEGKYRGQQEKYPTRSNEKAMPSIVPFVRQFVIGHSDPGKNHIYIIERYVEEVLKNLENLELVEAYVLKKPIAEVIASLKHLKALSLYMSNSDNVDTTPLAKIGNLKHLKVCDTRWSKPDSRRSLQPIILNSASTLETLDVQVDWMSMDYHVLVNWEKGVKLSSLTSLSLVCYNVEPGCIEAMQKAIDFTKLTKLSVGTFREENSQLFESLTALSGSLLSQGKSLNLRHLSLEMDLRHSYRQENVQEQFDAKCRFLASFDSLESLQLERFGGYSGGGAYNLGLQDEVLQAILRHRGLKVLRMVIGGIGSGEMVRELSPLTVRQIVDGLPELREFEFVPEREKMDEIAQSLAFGRNLSSVQFCSWFFHVDRTVEDTTLARVVKGFLNHKRSSGLHDLDTGGRAKPFVWENEFNLRKLDWSHTKWELASKFTGKSAKGIGKPAKLESDDAKHEVWFRDITRMDHLGKNAEYNYMTQWIKQIGED